MLNPETNSDSPSAKSKGVRFVSATHDTNQNIKRGKAKIKILNFSWFINTSFKFNLGNKTKNLNNNNARLIS